MTGKRREDGRACRCDQPDVSCVGLTVGRLADSRPVEGVTVATTRQLVKVIEHGARLPVSDVERATTRALAPLRPAV
jgi:hypothetical protein